MISFLALAAGWSRPRLEPVPERALVADPLVVEVLLGAVGVFVFAVTVYAGLAGTDTQRTTWRRPPSTSASGSGSRS